MRTVTEVKKGIIKTEDDIKRLGFLDWNRTIWNPGRDMRALVRWLNRTMNYTIIEANLYDVPQREDFPGWRHVGLHVPIGQAYWNWFHEQFWYVPEKQLVFSDSPDFWGIINFPAEQGQQEHRIRFWGDIGEVAIMAFVESLLQMRPGDLWITLHDQSTQLVLEARADFFEASCRHADSVISGKPDKEQSIAAFTQASLW